MPTLRCLSLLLFATGASYSWAVITPVAITGDAVAGLPGARYASFSNAQLNTDGQGAYVATLQIGQGGISTANNRVLISFNGTSSLNAQMGAGNVVGAPGTSYLDFQEFKVADSGDVLLKARLAESDGVTADNNRGLWRFSSGTGSLISRTGTTAAPGVSGAKFTDLGANVGTTHSGDFTFVGLLETGSGVSHHNDAGVWQYSGATGTLIAREDSAAPSVAGGLFLSFGQPAINGSNQLAFRANMKPAAGIIQANRLGIWVYNDGAGELIARAGSAEVPGSTGDFNAFDDPLINEAGQVAIRGTLASGQQGLWLYSGTSGTQLAITNEVGIPDLPTASFSSLGKPLLNESGKVIAVGTLTTDIGGVTTDNDTGLWLFDETEGDQLLAREGVGGVTGIAGASFATFERFAAIDDTSIYMNATLQASPGIIDETNNEGIWRVPFEGTPELIVRRGDLLAGRTIAELRLPFGEFDDAPLTGISNPSGELLFHADFTNGDSGLFLYSPSAVTEFADADFDQDGDVDQADLGIWKNGYSSTVAGDADDDGDTDGADFLTWQRQYTGPTTLGEVHAVPEPGVSVLLSIALVIAQARMRRKS